MKRKKIFKVILLVINILIAFALFVRIYIPKNLLFAKEYKLKSNVTMYAVNTELDIKPVELMPRVNEKNMYKIKRLDFIHDTVVITYDFKPAIYGVDYVTMEGEIPMAVSYMFNTIKYTKMGYSEWYHYCSAGYRALYGAIGSGIYLLAFGIVYICVVGIVSHRRRG